MIAGVLEIQLLSNMARLRSDMNKANRTVTGAMGGINRAVSAAKRAIVGLAAGFGIREIVRYADAWTNAANKLRQVTDSAETLSAAQSSLLAISNETRSSFEASATLFSRLSRSTQDLTLSDRELLDITRTINQSFAISGATVQEQTSAIIQLTQGLAAGALRGQEYNSVLEQAPGIARAIGESLGKTLGELRKFAAVGGITAEIVVKALQEAAESIDRDFAKSIATFGQSMQIVKNNMQAFIGSSTAVAVSVGLAGTAIIALSNNVDVIAVAVGVLATIAFAKFIKSLALSKIGIIANTAELFRYQLALARQAGASTAAAVGTTALTVATTALNRAFALMGGPIGAVLLVVVGLALAYKKLQKTQADALTGAVLNSSRQGLDVVKLHIIGVQKNIAKLSDEYAELEEKSILNVVAMARQVRAGNKLEREQEILNQLTAERTRLEEDAARATALAADGMENFVGPLQQVTTGMENANKGTVELIQGLKEQLAQSRMTGLGLELYTALLKVSEDATAEDRAEVARLTEELYLQQLQIEATEQAKKETLDAQSLLLSLEEEIAALGRSERANFLHNIEVGIGNTVTQESIDLILERAAALFDEKAAIEAKKIADREAANEAAENMRSVAAEGKRTARELEREWDRTRDAFAEFFTDFERNGGNAFDNLAKSFELALKRMIAQWLASGLMNIFSGNAFGSGGNTFTNLLMGGNSSPGGGLNVLTTGASLVSGFGGAGALVSSLGTSAISGVGAGAVGVNSMVAPGLAAKGLVSGISSSIVALATNPVTLTIAAILAAKAIADKFDDPDNFRRSNAGFLIADVPGANTFDVPAFDSGFDPIGFSRRSSMEDALAVINSFRAVDSALTEAAKAAGIIPNLSSAPFNGYGEEGAGPGLFFGVAGGSNPTPLDAQLNRYAQQWITAVAGQAGVNQSIIDQVIGDGTAAGIVARAQLVVGADASAATGLSRVPFDNFLVNTHVNEEVLAANDPRNVNNSLSVDSGNFRKMNETMEKLLLAMEAVAVASNATADALDEAVRNGEGSLSVRIAA